MTNLKIKKVSILDYGLCNLFSVISACKQVGLDPIVTSDHDVIMSTDGVILPGVGAFGPAIECIKNKKLDIAIKKFIATKKPFMGLCLGLHLLFDKSDEFGNNVGLGIIDGTVKKLPESCNKIPQINWNTIHIRTDNPILKGVKNEEYMYFIHSYYVEPVNDEDILTYTEYNGFKYCSSICRDNIYAFQFHPEKSATEGLKIYNNFKNILSLGV